MPDKPAHLLAYVGAPFTMCGRRGDTLPSLWLYWFPAHRLGYGLVLCEHCAREAGVDASAPRTLGE